VAWQLRQPKRLRSGRDRSWAAGAHRSEVERRGDTLRTGALGWADAQNDVANPTFAAYRKHREVARCVDAALALLAASSSQALWVTDRLPAPALRPLLDRVRSIVPPLDDPAGRAMGEELARLGAALVGLVRPPASADVDR
jgi:hypothetical protein